MLLERLRRSCNYATCSNELSDRVCSQTNGSTRTNTAEARSYSIFDGSSNVSLNTHVGNRAPCTGREVPLRPKYIPVLHFWILRFFFRDTSGIYQLLRSTRHIKNVRSRTDVWVLSWIHHRLDMLVRRGPFPRGFHLL